MLLLFAPALSPSSVHAGLSCGTGVPDTQQHPETSALIFRLCFAFYSVLLATGERGGDSARHKALWRQKSLDILCLLKLWKGEKEECCKSGKMFHPRAVVLGTRREEETGRMRAHPLSVFCCPARSAHVRRIVCVGLQCTSG